MRHVTALYISRIPPIISMTHKKCFGPRQKHSPFRFIIDCLHKKWKKKPTTVCLNSITVQKFRILLAVYIKKGEKIQPVCMNSITVQQFQYLLILTFFYVQYIYIYILHVGTFFFYCFP